MPLVQQVSVITIVLALFSVLCVSVNELKQNKKTCSKVISWHLKNTSVKFNASGVLKKGDGGKQLVQTEVIKDGVVNVTTSIIVCCPGYHINKNGRCKPCKRGWFGENCLQQCTGCKKNRKCDRVTGVCKECKRQRCEDEPTNETDSTSPSTTISTTPRQLPTQNTTTTKFSDRTTVVIHTTESIPLLSSCDICVAANNCTEQHNCQGLAANQDGASNGSEDDKSNTILIAVILSLGTCTILLLVGIVFRERYHKSRKSRKREIVNFPETTEYVDPEPIYFEIQDDDAVCNGHTTQNKNLPDTPKASNDYQMCENVNRLDSIDSAKDNEDGDECGYLNPYTPLRFARSETNLYRDKKARKQGEYDVIYSIAKDIPQEGNTESEENSDKIVEDDNKLDSSSQNEKLLNGGPVYFILEKVQKEADSHDIEREKLLSRSSRSSI